MKRKRDLYLDEIYFRLKVRILGEDIKPSKLIGLRRA